MIKRLKNLLPSKRKIMQLYFAVLFNANLKGFVTGNIYQGPTKQFCTPGLNCYSCPGAISACPMGALQGSFSADHSTFFYVVGILLLYCIMFGKMICGWVCPFGLFQELIYKIKTPKLPKSPVTRIFSAFKYAVLVFFVFIVPIMYAFRGTPLPAFCKYICPAGTLEGGIALLANAVNESYFSMLGPLFTWKFIMLISTVVGSIFVFRLFCRFICPLGALYGLFNRFSVFGIRLDNSKCTDCGLCLSKCKMDIKHPGDRECISCGACMNVCPTQAIRWKGPKILVAPNEGPEPLNKKHKTGWLILRIITVVLCLGLLGWTLSYYMLQPDTPPANPDIVTQDRGNQVGDLCYRFSLPRMDEEDSLIDPSATGKITLINFWGTWCPSCLTELPYFDQIAREYPQDVTVVAVHSVASWDTAPAYIAEHCPQSSMVFARDTGDQINGDYYSALGGRGTYPYTLVLDQDGYITDIFHATVTYEMLRDAVTKNLPTE